MQKRLKLSRVESDLRLPLRFVPWGSGRPVYRALPASRTDSWVRGPMTTGFAANLSLQTRCIRAKMLAIVSAIDQSVRPVRPAGVGHTSGCVNFVFARTSLGRRTLPRLRGRGLPRKTRGVHSLRVARAASADPQRSLPRLQRTTAALAACGRLSSRAGHNGKGLRASRESSDSANRIYADRDANRGSDSPVMHLPGAS